MEIPIYDYVMKSRELNENHEGPPVATIVESVVFTKEKMRAMGIPENIVPEGVWIGAKIYNKETFEKVKKGELAMFSIEGQGIRTEVPNIGYYDIDGILEEN